MLFGEPGLRILLYAEPVDMRKSFNGLTALVKNQMQEDPLGGCLFAFINRRRNYLKVLWFEHGGFCIWSKRLEQGRFAPITVDGTSCTLSAIDFRLLVEGLERRKYISRKRYSRVA